MVKEMQFEGRTIFICEICGLGYLEEKVAQDCEDYCREHPGSCSAEISKKAVYFPNKPIFPNKK